MNNTCADSKEDFRGPTSSEVIAFGKDNELEYSVWGNSNCALGSYLGPRIYFWFAISVPRIRKIF